MWSKSPDLFRSMYITARRFTVTWLSVWYGIPTFLTARGSRTGLTISETLNAFGLVEHSIWVEKEARQAELA